MMTNGKKILLYFTKHFDRKVKIILILVSIFLSVSLMGAAAVMADDCDNISNDISSISDKIACLSNKVASLSSQASSLKNQIASFNAQINLTLLKISDTQNKISLLGGRIDQLEVSLSSLTTAFSSRAVETYKLSKFENNFAFILSASDASDAVSRFHYLAKIQEADRGLLEKLQSAQTTYKGEKQNQESLQNELKKQQANLSAQKIAKNNLLAATQNDEAKYQSLLSQAIAQRNAFLSFVTRQGGASILNNQTVDQGGGWFYFNQRDSGWGNNVMGNSRLTMADYGCLVTSVAMLGTKAGRNIKPIDIAGTPDAFFSPSADTALLYWQFSVNGTNIKLAAHSVSELDSLLASGPVIVGLYSGPDHYIVLKSGSGGNYIMNDPFLENGGNRNFTDKYTTGNITKVFTASFN